MVHLNINLFNRIRFVLTLSLLGLSQALLAQTNGTISGTVVDSSGNPLIGVTVLKNNSKEGTVTDMDGHFSLSAEKGDVLNFTYIGFTSKEVSLTGQSSLDITLSDNSNDLDELVVVGYGTQKKVNLTGSVATISYKDIANKPVMSTAQALAGLAPGMSVLQNSGRPGAGASVKIRGTGTFSSASNDPLVLIDGLAGNIDDVDPNDIQNISFLKDAASASIYGNRAANGVILIETKKGSEGKVSVSYNGSLGWQKATVLPDFLPSWEYATYYNMAMENMGRQDAYSQEQIEKYRNGTDPDNYPNVNHLKWLLDSGSGFQHSHNISIQGGSQFAKYNFSGYRKQDGMTAETSNERVTALFSLNSKLSDHLVFSFNLNSYYNNYKAPNGEPQSIDGIIGYSVREGPIYAGLKSDGTFGYQDNYSPEAWLASESFIHNISKNISTAGEIVWTTPLDGLSLSGKAGVSFYNSNDKSFRANTYFSPDKTVGPASLNMGAADNTYTILEATATYEKQVKDHYIKWLIGSSMENANNKYLNGGRNTFPNNNLYELSAGSGATASNGSSTSEYSLLSFFTRLNYSWKGCYLLEANLRYDGSSRFAPGHRWGLFPSVSAGWRLTEENFFKNSNLSNTFDNLKLRLSYGVLGNQNIGVYPYQQTYSLGHDAPLGNPATLQSGVYMGMYNNPDITWEKTAITDFGLDFGLFNNRLTGTLDYFYKYTSDILAPVEVTSLMGRGVGQSNVGAVSNKGIELMLSYNGKH